MFYIIADFQKTTKFFTFENEKDMSMCSVTDRKLVLYLGKNFYSLYLHV